MKKLFKKAVTLLGSAVLVGATVGMAAAANYPSPFTTNTAVITSSSPQAAASDNVAASMISQDLKKVAAGQSVGGGSTVVGGDSYKVEKTSTKFHLGDNITDVISSNLDSDQLPKLLVDGKYLDSDNDEHDFTQSVTLDSGLRLVQFTDNDYKADTPTIGFHLQSNQHVLNYTLEFNDQPSMEKLETTDLPIMGKKYYVLDVTGNSITLLDSASDITISEGESKTVTVGGKSYTCSIKYISSTKVKLVINGDTTNSLSDTQTYKLKDGAYVGIKDIMYNAKDTGISSVEFSIGSGKLKLTNGQTVEMNEEDVEGLTATITNTTTLESISLDWTTDDEEFITKDTDLVMPGFGALKLSFGGLNFPTEEKIEVSPQSDYIKLSDFPLKDTTEDIYLLYGSNGNWTGIGKDSDEGVATAGPGENLTYDKDLHSYFVVSWSDGRDSESYIVKATNFKNDSGTIKTTFKRLKDGSWINVKTDRKVGDSVSIGSAEFKVLAIDKTGGSVTITNNTANTNFHTLYSKEGLKVYLPYDYSTGTGGTGAINLTSTPSSYDLQMWEEDKDGNLESGSNINATLGWTTGGTSSETSVSNVVGESFGWQENGDGTKKYEGYVASALATKMVWDKDNDQHSLTLTYHGSEVTADVYIASSTATITTGGEAGILSFKDSDTASFANMNLIVVGGSAINSIAAELLGGHYRGPEFTAKTGISAGQFLIKSFDRNGHRALLVAGYNAADTKNAATYLVNNHDKIDTTVGKAYKGTSATEATLITSSS